MVKILSYFYTLVTVSVCLDMGTCKLHAQLNYSKNLTYKLIRLCMRWIICAWGFEESNIPWVWTLSKVPSPKIFKTKVLRMWESRGSGGLWGLEIDDEFGHPLCHDPWIILCWLSILLRKNYINVCLDALELSVNIKDVILGKKNYMFNFILRNWFWN